MLELAAGFLGEFWRDVAAAVGSVGVAATFIGVIFAIIALLMALDQIRKTKDSAEAAREAADRTREDLTERVWVSEVRSAIRQVGDIRTLLGTEQYKSANFRLNDLRELMVQIDAARPLDPTMDIEFQDALAQINSLDDALIRQMHNQKRALSPVTAQQRLREVADLLTRLEIAKRLEIGAHDADS